MGRWSSMKGIVRVEKNSNYTVLHRAALNDKRLSWKAKGIIAYMLSMPDDWVFYMDELMTHSTDGEKAFRSGFKELKVYGYVRRFPVYEDKKIIRWETVVFESPNVQEENLLSQNVQVDKVHVGSVDVQKEGLLSTESLLNTDLLSTDDKDIVAQNQNDSNVIPLEEIVSYLNKFAGTNYKHTTHKTQQLIKARFKEGFTFDDFIQVIDKKVSNWINDPNMVKYLRPETLFGTKFESYLNEKVGGRYGANQSSKSNRQYEDGINF